MPLPSPAQLRSGLPSPEQLGKKKPGRLKTAGSSFVGSLKSAKERFTRGADHLGGNIFTNPNATMALLGGFGDVISAPLAAATGLVQPELEKGVKFVAEKIPESVKKFVGEQAGKLTPETKQFAGDALAATSLFLLSGLGKTAVKESIASGKKQVIKESLKKTGGKFIKSGKDSAVANKSKFLDDIVRANKSPKVAPEMAKRSKEVGKGLFKKTVVKLSPDEKAVKEALMKVKSIKPGQTAQGVLNKTDNALKMETESLMKQLAKKDVYFPKKELTTRLKNVSNELSENIFITGDKVATVERMFAKANNLIKEMPGKGSSLLKTRKDFDRWVKAQKGSSLFSGNDDAVKIANKAIRNTMNEFLDEKAVNVAVKESLKQQRTLIKALDTLAVKAGAEAPTAIGRGFQALEKTLGKNKLIKELAILVGVGTAVGTGLATPVGVGLATLFTGKKLVSLAKNPQGRILLGKLLQQLSKTPATGNVAIGEINALSQRIQEALSSSN